VPRLTKLCVRVVGDRLMDYESLGNALDLHYRSMIFLYLLQSDKLSSAKLHSLVGTDMTKLDLSSLAHRTHDSVALRSHVAPQTVLMCVRKQHPHNLEVFCANSCHVVVIHSSTLTSSKVKLLTHSCVRLWNCGAATNPRLTSQSQYMAVLPLVPNLQHINLANSTKVGRAVAASAVLLS
jgi:hypothetical protein